MPNLLIPGGTDKSKRKVYDILALNNSDVQDFSIKNDSKIENVSVFKDFEISVDCVVEIHESRSEHPQPSHEDQEAFPY